MSRPVILAMLQASICTAACAQTQNMGPAVSAEKKLIKWGADTPVSSWLRDYPYFT